MLEIKNGMKYSEEDNYEEGCLPDTGRSCSVDISFKANTSDELIQQLKEYFDVDDDAIELNSCDEDGRIDIFVIEDKNGENASDYNIKLWQDGKKILYAVTYSFYVEEVERKTYKFNPK
jgi:hypothetical protein